MPTVCDDRPVSSIIDFFVAPDDDAASAVLEHGPGRGNDVVDKYGHFDPVTTMDEWENCFDIVSDYDARLIASDDAPRLVYTVSASLQAALAAADEEQLEEAATRWVELRAENGEQMNRGFANDIMSDIASLARTATRRGHRLYYWWG
jgi:hypothetical protein